MDTVGGPDAKKARWSPTSFNSNGTNGLSGNRDAFANYGYGPNASVNQSGYNGSPTNGNGFNGNALYSTPQLSINTNTSGNGMPSQMSPNTAGAFTPSQQQPPSANPNGQSSPYPGFGAYNLLLPMMGTPGSQFFNPMANFPQVGLS